MNHTTRILLLLSLLLSACATATLDDFDGDSAHATLVPNHGWEVPAPLSQLPMDYTIHVWDTDNESRTLSIALVRYDFEGVHVESGPHEVNLHAGPAETQVNVSFSGNPGTTAIRLMRDNGGMDGHLIGVGLALTRAPEHVGWLPITAGARVAADATTPPLR